MQRHAKTQSTHTLMLSCLLPVLSGACSWVQALQDNLHTTSASAPEQITVLPVTEAQVRMLYPPQTDTVARAVDYILAPHAYRAAAPDRASELIARRGFINNFGAEPVPVAVALQRLLGADGQVVLDQTNRLYAFRLKRPHEPGLAFADLIGAPGAGAQEALAALSARPAAQTAPPRPAPAERAETGAASSMANSAPARDNAITGATLPAPESVPVAGAALPVAQTAAPDAADEAATTNIAAGHEDDCHSIHFRNRAMLSATVRAYFLNCGFDEARWMLGQPDRYADYQLMQNLDVPLPERHQDLIRLLQKRFSIRTLIHDNNRVEFQDENSAL